MSNVCYFHNDLDGQCAAVIVKKYLGNVECIPVQYDQDIWNEAEVKAADNVFVVDFTFPDMEKLAEVAGDKLIWCDHHVSAMQQHLELWNSDIKGFRSTEQAGCILTWYTCFEDLPVPQSVECIADRDLWKFEYDDTEMFCAGANVILDTPENPKWKELLTLDCEDEFAEIMSIGEVLLKSQAEKVKKLFDNGIDIEFHGHPARMCNTTSLISELGEYIYTQEKYKVAVMWQIIGNKIVVSLRSDTVNVAEIAQKYKGGGHTKAAGLSIENVGDFPYWIITR